MIANPISPTWPFVPQETPSNVWHRFEALVEHGHATVFLNAEEVADRDIPRGTRGMLALIVNYNSDARVRLRNLQITFLKPTPDQIRELDTDATTNWEDFKRSEVAAVRRKNMEDNSLGLEL
jgi:hypothetical protein